MKCGWLSELEKKFTTCKSTSLGSMFRTLLQAVTQCQSFFGKLYHLHGIHFPKHTDALLELAYTLTRLQNKLWKSLKGSLFFSLWQSIDVDNAMKKMFAITSSVQSIPPTRTALEQQAAFQGGIFGAKHHSTPIFHLHVAGVGFKPMMVYMNHFGPHFRKHQRAVMNCIIISGKPMGTSLWMYIPLKSS